MSAVYCEFEKCGAATFVLYEKDFKFLEGKKVHLLTMCEQNIDNDERIAICLIQG